MKIKDTVHFNWYKHLFLVALLAVCIGTSIHVTDADFAEVFGNLDQMTAFMKRFLNPDFSYIPKIVGPMILTIKMSVVGTVAGVILAVGRIVGETAALMYTAGTVAGIPANIMGSARTLSVHMYVLTNEGLYTNQSYATAVVLLGIVVLINALSGFIAKKITGKGIG